MKTQNAAENYLVEIKCKFKQLQKIYKKRDLQNI